MLFLYQGQHNGFILKKKLFIKISKKSIVFPYKNLVFNCWEKCYQSKIQKNIRHTTKIILKKMVQKCWK